MNIILKTLLIATCSQTLSGCDHETAAAIRIPVLDAVVSGQLEHKKLNEASGIQASHATPGHYFLVNDGGNDPELFVIDETGKHQKRIDVTDAKNRDWEDLASVPDDNGGRLLVIGDVGDNDARRKTIELIFVAEPTPGEDGKYPGKIPLQHQVKLRYPDHPRDCESIAWDPVDDRILLVTKRDKPPRIYAVDRKMALNSKTAKLEFLGKMRPFRQPDGRDLKALGKNTRWSAQPTGMDISPDGSQLFIISYRSLHHFSRDDDQDWSSALKARSTELIGPPSTQEESVGFSVDGTQVLITTEQRFAPLYLYRPVDQTAQSAVNP